MLLFGDYSFIKSIACVAKWIGQVKALWHVSFYLAYGTLINNSRSFFWDFYNDKIPCYALHLLYLENHDSSMIKYFFITAHPNLSDYQSKQMNILNIRQTNYFNFLKIFKMQIRFVIISLLICIYAMPYSYSESWTQYCLPINYPKQFC